MMDENPRILILEDTASDAELEVRELRKGISNSAIKVVYTKYEFEKALREFSPDIILSDYSMPSYDGSSAMHAAMELCPEVPFVFVSGAIEEGVAIEALKTGATDYVFKNQLVRLVPSVRRALREADESRQRKATEESLVRSEAALERQTQELKDLIVVAAHELRHPATVFRGYANILLASWEELDEDTIRDALSAIDKAAGRLASLVFNLLDSAVIESDSFFLSLSEADPREPVRLAVREARTRGPDNKFQVSMKDMHVALIDVVRLRHVLSILLENAVKFSPEGSTVEVCCATDDGYIVYSVADQGMGVPDNDKERIFERFYQVEDAIHHSLPGTGLGLYIARTVVEAHGGSIKVDPRQEGGSVFSFEIPHSYCRALKNPAK